ncbi:MAG: 30S ribosome-binding factor RbfA [Candidatus Lambdaproteobacteria bacterium]|nr:30S ribosome-binding factor RbfA [Candidatus Lambdaproteobacteria bacterium]
MVGRKGEHLNEQIRHKLGMILQREAHDPRFQAVTVTRVTLSRDRAHADVRFSCYRKDLDLEALTESLNRAAGFFGHALARSLETRRTPRLIFHYDPGFDHADEIERALKSIEPGSADPA